MLCRMCRAAIAAAGIACAAHGETFSLRHEATGRLFGPFDAGPGSRVVIGSSTFTVVRANAPASAAVGPLLQALQAVAIPQFEVRNASPEDCVAFVREVLRSSDKAKGVNVVTRHLPDVFSPGAKTVTCSLRSVSASQVLNEVCQQAGLAMSEEGGLVVIQPRMASRAAP
jgi:hypothetical protein